MQREGDHFTDGENIAVTGYGIWLESSRGADVFWRVECGASTHTPPLGPPSDATQIELFQESLSDALEHSKLAVRSLEGKRVVLMAGIEGGSQQTEFAPFLTRHLHFITAVEEHVITNATDPAFLLDRAVDALRGHRADVVILSSCNFSTEEPAGNGAVALVLELERVALKDNARIISRLEPGNPAIANEFLARADLLCFQGLHGKKLFPRFSKNSARAAAVKPGTWRCGVGGEADFCSAHPWRGFLKTLLAVERGVFPPGYNSPEKAASTMAPVRLWLGSGANGRRFGVTVVERKENVPWLIGLSSAAVPEISGTATDGPDLYVVSATAPETLAEKLEQLAREPSRAEFDPRVLANESPGDWRAALVAENVMQIGELALKMARKIRSQPLAGFAIKSEIFYSGDPSAAKEGKVVLMFPGQGSQFFNMNEDLLMRFPSCRELLEKWNSSQMEAGETAPARWIYPDDTEWNPDQRRAHQHKLISMECGGQAAFINSLTVSRLLLSLGVKPDCMVGNSQGETCALVAAGILDADDVHICQLLQNWSRNRSQGEVASEDILDYGLMLATTLRDRNIALKLIDRWKDKLFLALDNCPQQLVLFARPEIADEVIAGLRQAGGLVLKLPFDRPYHTPLFEKQSLRLAKVYNQTPLKQGTVPVYSCLTRAPFPEDPNEIRMIARDLWHRPVLFRETVERLYADGVRLFVDVGPGSKLAGYALDTLRGKDFSVSSVSPESRSSVSSLLGTLGLLFTRHRWDATRLYPYAACPDHSFPADAGQKPFAETPSATGPRRSQDTFIGRGKVPDFDEGTTDVLNQHFGLMYEFLQSQARAMIQFSNCCSETWEPVDGSANPTRAQKKTDFPCAKDAVNFLQNGRRENGSTVWDCELDLRRHSFLRHHAFGRAVSNRRPELLPLPIVPLAFSMKLALKAAVTYLQKGDAVVSLSNVRGFRWLTLEHGVLNFKVRLKPVKDSESGTTGHFRIHFEEPAGSATSLPLFQTEIQLGESAPRVDPVLTPLASENLRWNARDFYRFCLFHGDSFRVIQRFIGCSEGRLEAELQNTEAVTKSGPGSLPMDLVDAFGQMGGYWLVESLGMRDFGAFPVSIGKLVLFPREIAPGSKFICRVSCKKNDNELRLQVELLTEDGQPYIWVQDFTMQIFPFSTRYMATLYWQQPNLEFSTAYAPAPSDVVLRTIDAREHPYLERGNDIWVRCLAFMVLGARERKLWLEMTASRGRKLEWLLGRLAAKDAVREWARRHHQMPLYPADVEILSDDASKPMVHCPELKTLGSLPNVSISHSDGVTFAAAADADSAVGVDFECVGRRTKGSGLEAAFIPEERQLLGADIPLLVGWVCKEAAAKAAGVGLRGQPRHWKLVRRQSDSWIVESDCGLFTVHVNRLESGWLGIARRLEQEGSLSVAALSEFPARQPLQPTPSL